MQFDRIRMGLAQVVELLPSGPVETLQGRAAVAMARVALDEGDAESAHRRLTLPGSQIAEETAAELRSAITRIRREAAQRAFEAERMDSGVGRSLRGWLALVLGLAWVAMPLQSGLTGQIPSLPTVGLANAILGVVVVIVFAVRWRQLGRTVPNRLLLLCLLIVSFGLSGLDAWGHHHGIAAVRIYAVHQLLVAIAAGIFAIGIEARTWPLLLTTGGALVAVVVWPAEVMLLTAANNFFIWIFLSYTSLRPARRS